jgi:hypothetical protein
VNIKIIVDDKESGIDLEREQSPLEKQPTNDNLEGAFKELEVKNKQIKKKLKKTMVEKETLERSLKD